MVAIPGGAILQRIAADRFDYRITICHFRRSHSGGVSTVVPVAIAIVRPR